MDQVTLLPLQPQPVVSYLRVGRLLYASLILFILESYIYWVQLQKSYLNDFLEGTLFWSVSFLFSFVHIFLVLMDGWSRFQDYKRAKDLFFEYGVQPRIANRFIGSKCQRMAAIVAAEELGVSVALNDYYLGRGVKWYHYIPYFMVQEPLFLFKSSFWSRTFMEKNYTAKFDFHTLQMSSCS